MLAGGGEAWADIEYLRAEEGLFGAVPSALTLYRTVRSLDPATVERRTRREFAAQLAIGSAISARPVSSRSCNAGGAPSIGRCLSWHGSSWPEPCTDRWNWPSPSGARNARADNLLGGSGLRIRRRGGWVPRFSGAVG